VGDSVRSIVLPSGVTTVPPNTPGNIPQLLIGDTPFLTNSIMSQAQPPATPAIIVGTDPDPTFTEIFRMTGPAIIEGRNGGGVRAVDSVSLGRGATTQADSVVIGRQASIVGQGVVIGAGASGGLNFTVVLGDGAVGSGSSGSTALGHGARSLAISGTAVGSSSTASGNFSTAIGDVTTASATGAVALGQGATASGARCIAIQASGAGAVTASGTGCVVIGVGPASTNGNTSCLGFGGGHGTAGGASPGQIAIGVGAPWLGAHTMSLGGVGANEFIQTVVIGQGDTFATTQAITLRFTNRSGANVAASDFSLIAPRGTGTAASARTVLQVGVPTGAGSAQHPIGDALAVDGSTTGDDTRLLLYDVTAAALVRVTRGAIDSGGVGFRLLRVPN